MNLLFILSELLKPLNLKTSVILACFIGFNSQLHSQNSQYNDSLAKKLGADEYGMKPYILVILKTGSNTSADKHTVDSCFRGHMQNMERLVQAKLLVVAGPISRNEKKVRGIFILNLNSQEEALNVLQTDPAIHAKLLEPELYNWYGSAALPVYLETADKIWKSNP